MSVTFHELDSVWVGVECDDDLAQELSDHLTFDAPGAQFSPAYRRGHWDGKIRLFNTKTRKLYAGLLSEAAKYFSSQKIAFGYNGRGITDPLVTQELVEASLSDLRLSVGGNPIEPYDYQQKAVETALRLRRCLIMSPTGSGKSLVAYCAARLLQQDEVTKILIVVPTINLVNQMYKDFEDYSGLNDWNVSDNVHQIMQGREKDGFDHDIVISTWQSIAKMPKKWFSQFQAVIGDECHLFESKSLKGIMEKLEFCDYRIGMTATVKDAKTHKLILQGLFGPITNMTRTKDLQDRGVLSKLQIDCLVLEHAPEDRKALKDCTYQEEMDYLVAHPKRNQIILKLPEMLKGNTLVLFQYVEKHGEVLYKSFQEKYLDRDVYFIHGGKDGEEREEVRQLVEEKDDAIIVASVGTFSTGVNIRRLHNVVFASPSKSKIRVLQSIGRQLRTAKDKEVARLIDISDDLTVGGWTNYTYKHMQERITFYAREDFDYRIKTIKLY